MVIQQATINVNTLGDNTIIAAPASTNRIDIVGLAIFVAGAVNLQWKDGSTPFGGVWPAAGAGPLIGLPPASLGDDLIPYWSLGAGDALVLNLSAGVQVSGVVQYVIR